MPDLTKCQVERKKKKEKKIWVSETRAKNIYLFPPRGRRTTGCLLPFPEYTILIYNPSASFPSTRHVFPIQLRLISQATSPYTCINFNSAQTVEDFFWFSYFIFFHARVNSSRHFAGGPKWGCQYKLSQLRQGRLPNGTDEGRRFGMAQKLLPMRPVQQAAERRQLSEPRDYPILQGPLQRTISTETG